MIFLKYAGEVYFLICFSTSPLIEFWLITDIELASREGGEHVSSHPSYFLHVGEFT